MLAGVLKIPGLTIPLHSSIFLQDFPQSIFQQGVCASLKTAYVTGYALHVHNIYALY